MDDPAYPAGHGNQPYPVPGQTHSAHDPAYAPPGQNYPPPGQNYSAPGQSYPLPGQPYQDDPAYPAPRQAYPPPQGLPLSPTAPPPPMMGPPPPGQSYPPPVQAYPSPGQTQPPPPPLQTFPPPGQTQPPQAPPPSYPGQQASRTTRVITTTTTADQNMDFCSRCWRRDHPYKWYSLQGKGWGWIVVLVLMYFFVGIVGVILWLAWAILTVRLHTCVQLPKIRHIVEDTIDTTRAEQRNGKGLVEASRSGPPSSRRGSLSDR
ncbi:hypothetical protein Bbelb_209100 [Branchiostoma belcheri]|nr:hypothetical protein Bbelb_209100 [Branchiostoma belcheri]